MYVNYISINPFKQKHTAGSIYSIKLIEWQGVLKYFKITFRNFMHTHPPNIWSKITSSQGEEWGKWFTLSHLGWGRTWARTLAEQRNGEFHLSRRSSGINYKRAWGRFVMTEKLHSMTEVMVMWLCTFAQTHWTVHWKQVNFFVCKLKPTPT